jgi:hypothetical protein
MDDIALALNPPKFVKIRRPPIRISEVAERVWPLAAINGRAPVVFDARCAELRGVELAYPRFDPTDAVESCPIGSPNGTATHLLPPMTPALAIDGGEITFSSPSSRSEPTSIARVRSTCVRATRSATSVRASRTRSSRCTSSCGSATSSACSCRPIRARISRRGS